MNAHNFFSERLQRRREELGITLQEIADELGVARSTIQRYESGKTRDVKMPMIEAIADVLKVNPLWLVGKSEDKQERHDDIFFLPGILPIEIKKIPLLGEISCGELRYADEDFQGYVECGACIRADFALRAYGDSMINARIYDGDIVFIRQQPTVDSGEIAAVLVEDEISLKRVYRYGKTIVLHPENPEYDDIVVEHGEDVNIRILGKAVAFQSDVV